MTSQTISATDLEAALPAHYDAAPVLRKAAQLVAAEGHRFVPEMDCSGTIGLRMKFSNGPLSWIRIHFDQLSGFATTCHSGGNAAQLWTPVEPGLTYRQVAKEITDRLAA